MAYGVRNLRPQSVFGGFGDFDQITPDYGYQDNDNPIMDPVGQQEPAPYDPYNRQSEVETARTPQSTSEPQTIAAPKVDPNSGMTLQDWFRAINEGYTPQTYARDRFNTMIDQFPERKQPSGAMRWAAGLQGISQVGRQGGDPAKTVDNILSVEGNRAIDDWKTRIDPYHKAATLEGTANTQERTLMGNAVTGYMNDQRVRQQAEKADQQFEVASMRARAYDYSQRLGKGYEWDLTGPTAKKFNKTTGDIIDTGIPTGRMSEELRIELQNEGRINAAREYANAAMNRTIVGGVEFYRMPDGSWVRANPRDSNAPPPPPGSVPQGGTGRAGAAGNKPVSELERRRIEQKTMEDAWKSSKEARSVIAKEGNTYTWKKRPEPKEDTWWLPFDQSVPESAPLDYDETRKKYDPTYKSPTSTNKPNSSYKGDDDTNVPGLVRDPSGDKRGYAAGSERQGMIRMRAPDGSIRHVPAGRVAEAEKNGMRRMQ